jgi:hypothetical protein
MVVAAAVAASMTAATWGQASASTTAARAAQLPDAVEGRPHLHPITKLPIPAVNTIHMFSAQSKTGSWEKIFC